MSGGAGAPALPVTVGVVTICGAPHLRRCLAAVGRQEDAPRAEILVAAAPGLSGIEEAVAAVEGARLCRGADGSPPELAAAVAGEARGEIVALTEDHCEPGPRWIASLTAALREDRAAAGGPIRIDPSVSRVAWALSYSDLFRYEGSLPSGPVGALSVCNVAYRRADLGAIAHLWRRRFVEAEVHEALRRRGGTLWLVTEAAVRTRREARLRAGLAERAAFGRLFGALRAATMSRPRAVAHAALGPAVPLVLLARMARKAASNPTLAGPFLAALPLVTLFTLAWAWGEWVGHLTRHPPEPRALRLPGGLP